MARSGIYKSEVVRARQALLAKGRHPSAEAIRQELGNTGSYTTINRYLKEIEEEEGGKTGTKVSVSESIQDLVERLAARLLEETEEKVQATQAKADELVLEANQRHQAAVTEADNLRRALELAKTDTANDKRALEALGQKLQTADTDNVRLAQQVTGLQERLAEEAKARETLQAGLEHARTGLEHFRQAAKEQRDQEARKHEQSVQFLQSELRTTNQALATKQHELIASNQDNARLSGEAGRLQTALRETQGQLHLAHGELADAKGLAHSLDRLTRELAVANRDLEALQAEKGVLQADLKTAQAESRQLAVELANAQGAATSAREMVDRLMKQFAGKKPKAVAAQVSSNTTEGGSPHGAG